MPHEHAGSPHDGGRALTPLSGAARAPSLPLSGAARALNLPLSGAARAPSLPLSGAARAPSLPLSGAARALRVGVGGPVGTGKTALVAAICRVLGGRIEIGVVTNDIYTYEDAEFLRRAGVLDAARITGVQTGCCPHTAIRDDIAGNLDAVEELEARCAPLDLVLVESGGDNLTATFSSGLVDRQLFVLDVAGGDKVPRKGGPGVVNADLLVINKTDLAPLVGADLGIMAADADVKRAGRPVVMCSLVEDPDATAVTAWVEEQIRDWAFVAPQSGT